MELNLSGKTVLVTGSSRGLGASIAAAFLEEECHVIVNGRNAGDAEKTAKYLGNGASAIPADVTIPKQCDALVDEVLTSHGGLDVLICNVGNGASSMPGEETPSEWRTLLDINLHSTTNMVQSATESLAVSRGSIVCISSICGQEVINGAPVTYSSAKAALNAYVRGISRPLATLGIRINAIAPGNLLFPGSVWEKRLTDEPSKVDQMLTREVAMKRLGEPKEIAYFVLFLASHLSSFATGAVFAVDGGQIRS